MAVGGTALAACQPKIVEVTKIVEKPVEKIVKETVIVEGEPVEKIVKETVIVEAEPKVVEKVVEKVVTVAQPAKGPPTELRFIHWWPQGWHDTWLPMLEEKANVKFKQEVTPCGEYFQKVGTEFAAGTGCDIIQSGSNQARQYAAKDVIVPFDDALAKHGIENDKWSFDPLLVNGYKGKIYALEMFTMQAMVVWLNMDLIRKAGYPVEEVPVWGTENFDKWRWPDLVEFLKAVTMRKSDGSHESYGWANTEQSWLLDTHLATFPAEMTDDPDGWADTKSLVDEPEAIEAAHDLIDLTLVHEVAPSIEAAIGIEGGLYRAGMAVAQRSWGNTSLLDAELPFEVGMMNMPFKNVRQQRIHGNCLMVNQASKVIAKALEASILMCCDYQVCLSMMMRRAELPAYEPHRYLGMFPKGDYGDLFRINASRIPIASECSYCTENVYLMGPGRQGRLGAMPGLTITGEMELAYMGTKTVEEAMRDAAAAINAELENTPIT